MGWFTLLYNTPLYLFSRHLRQNQPVLKNKMKKNKTKKHMVMHMHEDCSNMNPEHSQGGGTQLHMWFADMHAYTLDLRY